MRVLLIIFILSCAFYIECSYIYDMVLDSISCNCNRVSNLSVSNIKIFSYNFQTNFNNSYYIDDAASAIFSRKDFDEDQCIHIFVPGFANTNDRKPAQTTRCLLSKTNCNNKKPLVLIVDHSYYTGTNSNFIFKYFELISLYTKSVVFAKSIGTKLGNFVSKLLERVDKDLINIMGHSLGGHIVGYIGETVQNKTGNPLKSIYAVDPSGPCFQNCLDEHVKTGQAETVVTFHCNSGELGSKINLADYDLYSGNGKTQDGCFGSTFPDLAIAFSASFCSHVKCVPIVQNTLMPNAQLNALKCPNKDDYYNGYCRNNELGLIGYGSVPTSSKGIYHFESVEELLCEIK